MRSTKPSKPSARILFVFGQGAAASRGIDLLSLFVHAGFSAYAAIHPSGQSWVTPEALAQASGHHVFTGNSCPGWVQASEPFQVVLCLGLPPQPLHELHSRVTDDPILKTALKRGTLFFLFAAPRHGIPDQLLSDLRSDFHELRFLPGEPGEMHRNFEQVFSEIVTVLHQQATLGEFSARVIRSVPSLFDTIACGEPTWHADLSRRIRLAGFATPPEDPARSDVLIETFEGPFPVPPKKGKKIVLTFDPNRENLPEAKVRLRFVHPEISPKALKQFTNAGVITVLRAPDGDLKLVTDSGSRLIPNLGERPANQKLLEIVINELFARTSRTFVHD